MQLTAWLILVASLPSADGDDAMKKEKKSLAGGWTVVSAERDGEAILPDEARKIRLYFGEERLTLKQGEKGKELPYTLGLDTRPRTIDLKATDGPFKGKPLQGIYELSGDSLKVCIAFRPDSPRPTEFATSAGSALMLLVLKREKSGG